MVQDGNEGKEGSSAGTKRPLPDVPYLGDMEHLGENRPSKIETYLLGTAAAETILKPVLHMIASNKEPIS